MEGVWKGSREKRVTVRMWGQEKAWEHALHSFPCRTKNCDAGVVVLIRKVNIINNEDMAEKIMKR